MATTRPEALEFVDLAPLRAVATREICADPERIFDVLADAGSWPHWFPNMTSCRWLTPPPHGVDSQREVRVGPLHVVERFVIWARPSRWGFTFTAASPAIARAGVELVELTPLGQERTQVTYTMALEPRIAAGSLTRAVEPAMEATLRDALAGLDDHVTR
jgi:uncharacterized protein YndB with AHSA1/START domain